MANLSSLDHVKISVEDTGIGIVEHKIPHIFTMFGKLEGNQSINAQGCGLGLSISTMLVCKLGGSKIQVTSVPSQGSTFSFSIPIISTESTGISLYSSFDECDTIPCEQIRGDEIAPCGRGSCQGRADVLIVDDSPFNRLVIRKMLESVEISYAEASTGLEALSLITSASSSGCPFKVVVMDIEMPEMDGIAATRELKLLADRGAICHLPVIIGCSAFSTEEDKTIALTAGMSYYIEKPISRTLLIQLVGNFTVIATER